MKQNPIMFAIIGDICGSRFEHGAMFGQKQDLSNIELMHDDCTYTDDTVLTISFCRAILENYETPDFAKWLKVYTRNYPYVGYGGRFLKWVKGEVPGNSYGNGAYMRISPVLWAYGKEWDKVFAYAAASIGCSHNHPYTYKYLRSIVFNNFTSDILSEEKEIAAIINRITGPKDWDHDTGKEVLKLLHEYAKTYKFDATCPGSIPEALLCGKYGGWVGEDEYTGVIRAAISLGGDTDTQACIAGMIRSLEFTPQCLKRKAIIPQDLYDWAWNRLPKEFQDVLNQFNELLDKIYANA